MIHLSHTLVLLDTNVLVHLARQDATGVWIEDQFALTARADRPLISTIAEGEILGFARQRNWGATRMADLTRLLGEVVRVDAGLPEVVDAYEPENFSSSVHYMRRGLCVVSPLSAMMSDVHQDKESELQW